MRFRFHTFVFIVNLYFQTNCAAQYACSDKDNTPGLHVLNATSVQVSFPESITNGKIEYWFVTSLGCLNQKNTANTNEKKIVTKSDIIVDLLPFSLYNATITYSNNGVSCVKERIFNTTALDTLGDEEEPVITHKYTESKATISVKWRCEDIGGPILYNISITRKGSPIKYRKNETDGSATDIDFEIDRQGGEYLLNFKYWRGPFDRIVEYVAAISFQAPGWVRDIKAYDVNDESISLKWLPPDQLTDNVELYEISFYKDTDVIKTLKVDGESTCSIWPDYICYTIKGDKFLNEGYIFEIQAKNRYVDQLGKISIYASSSSERLSSPPEHVSIIWFPEKHLVVAWRHPDIPNGQILQFFIEINNKFTLTYEVENQLPNYAYKIDVTDYDLKPKKLLVEIIAMNKMGNSTKGSNWQKTPRFSELPTIENATDTKFDISIPPIVDIEGDISKMYIVITDTESPTSIGKLHSRELKLFNEINVEKDYSWTIGEFDLKNITTVTVGSNSKSISQLDRSWTFNNKILKGEHSYNVTIVLSDTMFETTKIQTYTLSCNTSAVNTTSGSSSNNAFVYLLSLLLIPAVLSTI